MHRFEFQGVDIHTRQTRHYRYGETASHVLGYVAAITEDDLAHIDSASYAGTSLIGKLGIESSYEGQLHGHNGFREILVNAEGRSVERQGAYESNLKSEAGKAGSDLQLSIDLPSQKVAEEGLAGHRGAVVAIDPNNGDVIALASAPGFDPARFAHGLTRSDFAELSDDPDKPLINRALRGAYPSGSTIKPVIALAGLTDKVISADKTVFCPGVYHLPGSRLEFREGKTGRHGTVDMEHAIARSCDVYFYCLATTLGVDRIATFMASFGYGALTGIDIGGEKPGILPSREWKTADVQEARGSGLVSGRNRELWRRPGLPARNAAPAGARRLGPRHARQELPTKARDRRLATPPITRSRRSRPIANPPVEGVADADWDVVLKRHEGGRDLRHRRGDQQGCDTTRSPGRRERLRYSRSRGTSSSPTRSPSS